MELYHVEPSDNIVLREEGGGRYPYITVWIVSFLAVGLGSSQSLAIL
jgi:hypothetical protein